MKKLIQIIIALILASTALADCAEFPGTGIIDKNIKLCSDTYDAPQGLQVTQDNVMLDCGTAVLRGNYQQGIGIKIENKRNITITKCNILTYNVGIFISNSSYIHLYDNAVLKNDVGVRMYNSYENTIEKHNDKSLIKPVSALNSKFNTVLLGNKRIDREFCEVNACNIRKDMNPCENNDFYCSPKCTPETDNDCGKKEQITAQTITEMPEQPEEKPQETTKENQTEEETKQTKPKNTQIIAYVLFYLLGLLVFQSIKYIKEFDEEDR